MNDVKKLQNKESLALKAGIWYTFSNFLIKATGFLTTPIFARMLTKSEYGSYSNLATWISIMAIITGFDAHTSIIRYKNELKDDLDSYALSAMILNTCVTILVYGICLLFKNTVLAILGMDEIYLHMMFIYLMFYHAFNIMLTKNRAFYKYKLFVFLSAMSVVGAAILSVILVIDMQNKLMGRVIGQYLPTFIMSLVIYLLIFRSGKKVRLDYWKKACVLCLPLIPHLISLYILSSSDKIIITNLCGSEMTAIYSISYSCVHILSILYDSMNKAWAPWLMDSLYENKHNEIGKVAVPYFLGASLLSIGVILAGPEIICILGGENYQDAIYCLPPLVVGTLIQVLYTMYVNVEFYCKKTKGIAIASVLAAIINIVLNLLLIPIWGYIVAAYTTLIGYLCLLGIHYYFVQRLGYGHLYDRKICFGMISVMIIAVPIALFLYDHIILRCISILSIGIVVLIIIIRLRLYEKIIGMLKKNR